MAFATPARAVNWEGHDAWFFAPGPHDTFFEGIPGPLVKPLPNCAERRAQHAANTYEQTAIPGKNCVEKAVN